MIAWTAGMMEAHHPYHPEVHQGTMHAFLMVMNSWMLFVVSEGFEQEYSQFGDLSECE